MYSAVHHQGQRLYELARQGIEVRARAARGRHPRARRRGGRRRLRAAVASCAARGRTSARWPRDLGAALGCGAAVERLVRTRVGPFALDGRDAVGRAVHRAGADAVGARAAGRRDAGGLGRRASRRPLGRAVRARSGGGGGAARRGRWHARSRARGRRADARSRGGGPRRAADPAGADPSCRSSGASSPSRLTPGPAWSPSAPSTASISAHRAILGTAVARARAAGLQALACTFEQHPLEILQPARAPEASPRWTSAWS